LWGGAKSFSYSSKIKRGKAARKEETLLTTRGRGQRKTEWKRCEGGLTQKGMGRKKKQISEGNRREKSDSKKAKIGGPWETRRKEGRCCPKTTQWENGDRVTVHRMRYHHKERRGSGRGGEGGETSPT